MRNRAYSLLLIVAILLSFPAQAFAAPTSGQIDFISRMGQNGYIVEQRGYVFYAHKNAIWRMYPSGKGSKKQYVLHAPFDLQNHGGKVYFIDRNGAAYTLYRFAPGDAKPTKLLEDVFDAVIGGDILYYVNKAGDTLRAWDLRADKKYRLYSKAFTGAHDLNYMQGLLTFTATLQGKKGDTLFLYSPEKNHATYFADMTAKGLHAQGNYIFLPYDGGIMRAKIDFATPAISPDSVLVKGVQKFFMVGDYFYYWKEKGNDVTIYRRKVGESAEKEFFRFDKTKLRNVSLHPTAAAIWVYTEDKQGAYYKMRLSR